MDATALALEVPQIAPPSTDNNTVILWVVGVLFVSVVLVIRHYLTVANRAQAKCEENAKELGTKLDKTQDEVKTLYSGMMSHHNELGNRMANLMEKSHSLHERSNDIHEEVIKTINRNAITDRHERRA
jgi:signal transduction histidine kinase